MPHADANPLHAAAYDGRLADLSSVLTTKDEDGTLAAALAEDLKGTPLDHAAKCAQPEGAAADGVRMLIVAGADATAKDRDGYTALHWAAEIGPDDPSLAGLLLIAGCDPAAEATAWPHAGRTALGHAKAYNKPRMAALLEAARADPEATLAPFRAEVAALRQLVAERGLEAGLAAAASEEERLAAVQELEPQYEAMVGAMREAAQATLQKLAKEAALRAEADAVDLHAVATEGRLADLSAGVGKKEAAGQLEAALAERDRDSRTPLHRAAECTQPEGAAANGVRLLVAAGADATADDGYGQTALHFAAYSGPDDPAVAGVLMASGCDPAAKTRDGQTALDLATQSWNNKPRMATLLEAARADPKASLGSYRAEVAALAALVGERGLEAGLAEVPAVALQFQADHQAAEAKHIADNEKRKAEEKRRRAEEKRRRAEEERLRAEEEERRKRVVAESEADALGRADRALPEGTCIRVAGRGRGAYARFGKKSFGANEHTIAFDSGETAVVNLKKEAWSVKQAEILKGQALPEGTRICIAGRGRGICVSFADHWPEPSEHTIRLDDGEMVTVKLAEEEWTVKEAEMDVMDPPPPPMTITIQTLERRTIPLELPCTAMVGSVKAMIEEREGIPADRQRLLLNHEPLSNGHTLLASGVEDGAVLSLVLRLAAPKAQSAFLRTDSGRKLIRCKRCGESMTDDEIEAHVCERRVSDAEHRAQVDEAAERLRQEQRLLGAEPEPQPEPRGAAKAAPARPRQSSSWACCSSAPSRRPRSSTKRASEAKAADTSSLREFLANEGLDDYYSPLAELGAELLSDLADVTDAEFAECGIPREKGEWLRWQAQAVRDGDGAAEPAALPEGVPKKAS